MEDYVPLSVLRMVYDSSRKLYSLRIMASIRPSALAEITSVFAKHNINILCIELGARSTSDERGTAFLVVDFTKSAMDVEQIIKELEGLPSVLEVKLMDPSIPGLIIDTGHFPLIIGPWRGIIFRVEFSSTLSKALGEN
ncbi:MAG: hypothetical protein DRJ98_06570 [Thermoprotei archaeon]|nr:MAG: hypothetical protein DRJ98_06570 [Thermoprotei archaeon]